MTGQPSDQTEEIKSLLAEILPIPGVSGFEEPMIRFVRDRLAQSADEVEVDVRGNVYAHYKGTVEDRPLLMIPAHMDTLGFVVQSIDDRGFIRFARGTLALTLSARRVRLHGSKGVVTGVIGCRIGYSTSKPEQMAQAPDGRDMYIDAGFTTRQEAEEAGIEIGTPATCTEELVTLGMPTRIAASYLDNRAGCAVMLALAERIRKIDPRGDVVLVGTIEEELGLRGASTAAFHLRPDVGISVDTQPVTDTPEYGASALPLTIGAGPVIKFSENARTTNHPRVRELLRSAAEEAGVPYQVAACPPGGTDMGAMEQAGPGVPAAALGLPRRFAHSPNEVMDLRDICAAVPILEGAIRMLAQGYSLQRV